MNGKQGQSSLNLVAKELAATAGTLVAVLLGFGFVVTLLTGALDYPWLLPLVALLLGPLLIYIGQKDLSSRQAQGYPIRKGLAIFVLMVLIATAVFGALSLWLAMMGWAEYGEGVPEDFATYSGYYVWLFLDIIPALQIPDTLGLTTSVSPTGFVAGLPVLLFRVLVIYCLLRVLRVWWRGHRPVRKTTKQLGRASPPLPHFRARTCGSLNLIACQLPAAP